MNLAAKFPAILDCFLLGVYPIGHVPTWVGGKGRRRARRLFKIFKEKGLRVHQAKLWASQAFKLAKMKGNSQQTPLFNTTELCSHSQPSQDWPTSIWTPDRSYKSPLCFRKAADLEHSSVACFEYEIY